ncbi:MAG TPA: rod shape-determining protein MreC [Candidatus Paceibacterota bacterium]|nr:rod shape-determining protein MreC [Candidatus Paceibacterota bacterium]
MMHPYLDKKQIVKKKKIVRNIIGFGLFLILAIFGVLSWTSQFFNYVGSPIWKAEKFVTDGFYNINYLFRTKSAITNENHNLIEEISNIRLTLIDYQILKNENSELRELLGRVGEKHNFILGNILTKPNHSPYDTITIDIGVNEGVKEGNRVYANGNVPIGMVSNVYDKTSLVTLYTNPGQKTEGFLDVSNASVTLTGRGGGNFEMIVPIELSVQNGTIVYLPSDKALVVAQVDETISKPSDPFKKVILSSPVNVQNLKWVQVKKD